MATVIPGHGRARPAMNAEAHTWKACWVNTLTSSNLVSSAAMSSKNAGPVHADQPGVDLAGSFS